MIADIATKCGYDECPLPHTGIDVVDVLVAGALLVLFGLCVLGMLRCLPDAE